MRALALILLFTSACAPYQSTVRMPNPAKTFDRVQAKQEYEIGPNKERHRYEVELGRWTPTSVDFDLHLVNTGPCADPQSYVLTLVDDAGKEYPFHQTGAPTASVSKAGFGIEVHDVKLSGSFDARITAATKGVVLRVRPAASNDCSSVDFRWELQ